MENALQRQRKRSENYLPEGGREHLTRKRQQKVFFNFTVLLIFKKRKVKKLWKRKKFLKMIITGSRNKLLTGIFVLNKIKMGSETSDSD